MIPTDVVRGCPQYRIEMRGVSVPHGAWVVVCGTDLVRTHDGFQVLEDNLRVPSGVSYMIANRKVVKRSLRRLYRSCRVREVEHYGSVLRETLCDLAPGERSEPCIVLLTPGVYNSAFYEHMFLAHEIGAELVEGRDLLVNDGFVYMRTIAGRLPELGWTGFDATNQSLAGEGHVRIAAGRDYRDVSPTRGIIQGGGKTRLEVEIALDLRRGYSFPD